MQDNVRGEFLPTTQAPGEARRWLTRELALDGRDADDVGLLVTELVTNSVLHAGLPDDGVIVVHADRLDGEVHLEVCDEGGRFTEPSTAPRLTPGGRGLDMVAALSSEWGVHHDGITRVWATYTLTG